VIELNISIEINGNPRLRKPEGQKGMVMMGNLTIDPWDRIFIQEYPLNSDRLAGIRLYDIDTDEIKEIAQARPRYFGSEENNHGNFISKNEQSSGIVLQLIPWAKTGTC
jgi:hypothetical protein